MNKRAGKHFKENSIWKISSRGKHAKPSNYMGICKNMLTPVTIVVLLCVITGSAAYLIINNNIKNTFIIGEVKTEIVETFDAKNKTKDDVYIKNIGNVPIYIRTAILINWKDKDGRLIEVNPEKDIDYSIDFSTSTNWIKGNDGYYYYKNPISEKNRSDILIEQCIQKKEYQDRVLEVSIAVQAIQAEPSKAVIEAWNVDVIDGILVLKE